MSATTPDIEEIFTTICGLIEPFNTKNVELEANTSFQNDLDLDSLTVMDLVAAIEDEYDILLPLNMLPDLETIEQVAKAVEKILKDK